MGKFGAPPGASVRFVGVNASTRYRARPAVIRPVNVFHAVSARADVSEHSIIAELTSWKYGRATGLRRFSVVTDARDAMPSGHLELTVTSGLAPDVAAQVRGIAEAAEDADGVSPIDDQVRLDLTHAAPET